MKENRKVEEEKKYWGNAPIGTVSYRKVGKFTRLCWIKYPKTLMLVILL